ncbi:MAG: response regulator [Gammaproteobacteria bacterium]|nr:response regulator [Gammaproteobacteria bacterium]
MNKVCASCSRQEEHDGMVGLLCILSEGIDDIVNDISLFTAGRMSFLAKIPGYVIEHLNFPESRMPCSFMVRHMSSPLWVRPLSAAEQQKLIDRITHKTDAESVPSEISLFEFPFDNVVSNTDEVAVDAFMSVPEIVTEADIQEISLDDLLDKSEATGFAEGDGNSENNADEISIDAFISVGEPDIDSAAQEISLDDLINLSAATDSVAEAESYIAPIEHTSVSPAPQLQGLSDKTRELIELISAELEEIIEFYTSNAISAESDINSVIKEAASLAGNVANAVRLVGLEALAGLCEQLSGVFNQNGFETGRPIETLVDNLLKWPQFLLDYLHAGFDETSSRSLITYLTDNDLISRLDDAEKNLLVDRLVNPVFPEEDKKVRYDSATADDVDLSLPDDVNPELLESLLQDLPKQTEELTSALISMRDARDLDSIEIAQRIAHTLKGSANVVGVKGIANISHHLEDILEHLTKSHKLPSAQLMDVLMESSDCIESMADSLLGYDAPPEHALDTLQSVLNWSNRINEQGLDAATVFDGVNEQQAPNKVEKNRNQAAAVVENTLRIPAHLADDLLRLAGENLITTGQIQESIRNSLNKQGLLKNHNRLLQQIAFDLEHLIDIQGITANFNKSVSNDKFDSLELDEYHELHTISRRLIEISADSLALTNDLNTDLSDLHNLVISHGVIQRENQELVLRTRMLPVKSVIPRLKRGIRQICRLTGKDVDLDIQDNDVYLDSEVINELIEPLMHLLRNAVDHGIESAEVREAQGKPARGNIKIVFSRVGDSVQINVEDDGQGLDTDKIYAKAISKNLIKPDAELSTEETFRLILLHGFSTRDEATQVSGRGVGLDVVSVKIRELKGSIEIGSRKGEGCAFKLKLPVSSFSTHSLLVRLRQNIYAISSRGVEEILFPGSGTLVDHEDGMTLELDGESYNAIIIDSLFKLDHDRRTIERSQRPILLVKDEIGNKTAILVQDIMDSRHVVVKPLGLYLPKLTGVVGSTILGDGSVAPVIDLPDLLQHSNLRSVEYNLMYDHKDTSHRKAAPYVLVVDDSLSARRSLMHFVQDLGIEVREARDGIEAVSMIDIHRPDLVLVDMEMPRMNGLELTSHIRTNYDASTLPVIMITSRSSEKHRVAALERGVNHFMVKPFAEEELAQQINSVLASV